MSSSLGARFASIILFLVFNMCSNPVYSLLVVYTFSEFRVLSSVFYVDFKYCVCDIDLVFCIIEELAESMLLLSLHSYEIAAKI